jgi:hypothetical protein
MAEEVHGTTEAADPEIEREQILNFVKEARRASAQDPARQNRLKQNQQNLDMAALKQDYSNKRKGQSREVLPKVATATEQIATFVKRALTDFGHWFQVELPDNAPITDSEAREWLLQNLNMQTRISPQYLDFPSTVSDAMKVGLLESMIVFKVHGKKITTSTPGIERTQEVREVPGPDGQPMAVPVPVESLIQKRQQSWRLLVELIPPEDYYPDPTGACLYEIHSVEKDLWEVVQGAEDGMYDHDEVMLLVESAHGEYPDDQFAENVRRKRGQMNFAQPAWRTRVRLDEFWGNILDEDGGLLHENVVCTVANDRYLVRKPQPNGNWHGQSPFVAAPLIRVPFSVWHKALMDAATYLNIAMDEMFNLMLDGGLAAVWGTRQIRPDLLEDARQISDGVPQGETLVLRDGVPLGAKVLEQVATGAVPPDALNMYGILDREFQGSSLILQLNMGALPPKQVKATEIVEAQQSTMSFFDGVARDLENRLIAPTLWKAWCNMLQNADDTEASEIITAIGPEAARTLAGMSPAMRFVSMSKGAQFKVSGVSAVAARSRTFQKLMAFMQAVSANPLFMQAFTNRFSVDKVLDTMMQALNLDPRDLEKTDEERAREAAQAEAQAAAGPGPPLGGGAPGQVPGGGPGPAPPGGAGQLSVMDMLKMGGAPANAQPAMSAD